ncbi:TIM barrel protein [Occallatibacter savannae]|uniref:TIM barrel protein n=1 Tax=Occallatibacter savannae TaxID=1002691 RepID=UPI000D68EEAE|nr:TIM barrel protein [Occallatibacter savannae]
MNSCSRRSFLKKSTALAAASVLGIDALSAATLKQPIGLQLYSVRNLLPKNFQGTLDQLAAAGYKEVEAAGYLGKTAADFGNALQKAGLKCISTHHALTELKSQLSQLIEYSQALGLEYMICSWAGVHRDPSRTGELNLDDWRYVADQFNAIGQKIKAAGMTFGYHNHTIEFGTENGVVFFDELLKRTDPKLVCFEMDCGWVVAGGHNPVEYLSKSPDRFPLFHIKDLVKGPDGKWRNVVMGKGSIDYKPILRAATGLKHYFIEQEEFQEDPMTELRQDADFIRSLNF